MRGGTRSGSISKVVPSPFHLPGGRVSGVIANTGLLFASNNGLPSESVPMSIFPSGPTLPGEGTTPSARVSPVSGSTIE